MARIAHIDSDGRVVNVIEASDREPHKAPPPPDGLTAVVSDQADVGLIYDAASKTFGQPELAPDALAAFAQGRFNNSFGDYAIQLPAGRVIVETRHLDMLSRAAAAASRDPHFTMDWPQPQIEQGYVSLTAPQLIALNDSVHLNDVKRTRALRKALDDIRAGKIKRYSDLHGPAYDWPKRSMDR